MANKEALLSSLLGRLLGSLGLDLGCDLLDGLGLRSGLGTDLYGDLGVDVAIEVDLDLVEAGGLDGAAARDALAIDLDAELCLIASTIWAEVTEPKSWPSSPIRASTTTFLPSRVSLTALASARRFSSRFSMLWRRSSSCLMLPGVAG